MMFLGIWMVLVTFSPWMRFVDSQQEKCNSTEIQRLCIDQDSCDECINKDPCCNWCFDKNYRGRRCNLLSQMNGCSEDKVERNAFTNVTITENEHFEADSTETTERIQMQPQKFKVVLRRDGTPVDIDFVYKPVADYPLELYFLGDLSESMGKSLDFMKSLGLNLTRTLESLTKNFKIAYGSFLDKIGMPFYFMDPENFENPCSQTELGDCEKGYLFKHTLDFTSDVGMFSQQINNSRITASADDLDGALDAILQILVCGERIGWSENSRKIVLLPTDSLLHSSGDGKLLGAVLRPTEECLLDGDGNLSQTLKYDYPTLEQIVTLLRQKKVNIIFAVKTKTKLDYYQTLSDSLVRENGFVGELQNNSENILELIRKGYQNFAEQATFYINTTTHNHLGVTFYADCNNEGRFTEKSSCYGVKNQAIKFRARIYLKDKNVDIENEKVYIEEKNINERIELSIEYFGKCKCKGIQSKGLNCKHGEERCGVCNCESNWTGENCTESCENTDRNSCRQVENGDYSKICNLKGDCVCGKCNCYTPNVGKFCQFECPLHNRLVCSGPQHGKCVDGKCICENGYSGVSCSCSTSKDNCDFGGEICSGHGECKCNECECDDEYNGKNCETKKSDSDNNTICEEYEKYPEIAEKNGTYRIKLKDNYEVLIEETATLEKYTGPVCTYSSSCNYEFTYYQTGKQIHLPTIKACSKSASFGNTIAGIVVALLIVIAGIIGILIQKCRIYRQERLEYQKFMQEQNNANEMNPLYISPITEYENPLSRKRN